VPALLHQRHDKEKRSQVTASYCLDIGWAKVIIDSKREAMKPDDLPPKVGLSDSQMDGLYQIIHYLSQDQTEFLGCFPSAVKRGYLLYFAAFVVYCFSWSLKETKSHFVGKLGIDPKAVKAVWNYVTKKHQADLNLMQLGGLELWALRRFGMTVEEQLEDAKQFLELNRPLEWSMNAMSKRCSVTATAADATLETIVEFPADLAWSESRFESEAKAFAKQAILKRWQELDPNNPLDLNLDLSVQLLPDADAENFTQTGLGPYHLGPGVRVWIVNAPFSWGVFGPRLNY
jgi:hypothetical protein